MATIGIDIGAYEHAVAVCRDGAVEAERRVLKIPADRAGFGELADSGVVRRLRTIPGVGASTAAALVAEIGDIFRFDDFDQLVAFAGVHAAERSSGKKGRRPRDELAHGQDWGRVPARGAVPHGPGRHRAQARRPRALPSQARGQQVKMNALGHCMKKALAIVWGVWRGGHDFVVPEGIPS